MPIASSAARVARQVRVWSTSGTASIAVSALVANVLRIVSSMTLTRLLDPSSYGVVGIITSIAYMLAMLSDIGLEPFILRHKEVDSKAFLDQVWTIRLIRGICLTLAMILISEPAAHFVQKPELGAVIRVWSVASTLDGLNSLAFATALRGGRLWRLTLFDISVNLITFVVSVIFAAILHSYWAMVIGMVSGQVGRAVLSYVLFTGSTRAFSVNRARSAELWKFSRYIAVSSVLSLIIMQADKVILARIMPLAAYGYYAIATTLAVAPEAIVNAYGQRILYPAYARAIHGDRAALRDTFYKVRAKVTPAYSFAVGLLIGGAPLVVAILYDRRYAPVALFLQFLAFRAFLRLPVLAANEMLVALGRTRSVPATNLFRIAWLGAAGAFAFVSGHVMWIVIVVGFSEVPALLWYWFVLRQEKLLSLRRESYGFLAGAVGFAFGFALVEIWSRLIGR
jgi:O-antigen/teichoic acid export membrane protein